MPSTGFPVALGTHRAQISGDLVAKPHELALSNVQLKLDKGQFEGTLAVRRDRGRDLVQGTLATDMLDVDALVGDAANRHDMEAFYRKPLDASSFRTDIDMRVSALESRVGRLHLDETAFAALLRDGRLEISIDEARGYGGTLKARAIAYVNREGAEAQAAVTLSGVDLGQLSEALSGQERVSGQITGNGRHRRSRRPICTTSLRRSTEKARSPSNTAASSVFRWVKRCGVSAASFRSTGSGKDSRQRSTKRSGISASNAAFSTFRRVS